MVESPEVQAVNNPIAGASDDAGDRQFLRFATRGNGVDLPAGVLRYAENVRLGDKTVKVRKGAVAVATDLSLDNPPVLLDFTLGADVAVTSITCSGTTATVTTTAAHGYSTGNLVAIEGAAQAEYNGDFTITVTAGTTFTYTVAGTPATPATGTITCNRGPRIFDLYSDVVHGSMVVTSDTREDGFILAVTGSAFYCRGGEDSIEIAYPDGESCTGPVSFEQFEGKVYLFRGAPGAPVAVTSITRSSTTATVTTAAAHGLETGDWAYIEGGDQNEYRGLVSATVTDATHFTYAVVGTAATPATGTFTVKPSQPPMVWDRNPANDFVIASTGPNTTGTGKIKLPPAEWGVEFNRRMWLPLSRDQIVGSDYSDANTIDTLVAQTRIRPGGNDWLVGALGFANTRLIVAYRKSLHLMALNTDDLGINSVARIPAAYGCVARETLKDCNGKILFLSDNGVARLNITSELNIIADSVPLSDDIQDLFDRVNWAYAHQAVAVFYNNRYYLAVPLDDATTNNTVFVYSFLSGGGWESVDTYPGDFDIQSLHSADRNGRQRLYVVTTLGALYLLEEGETDQFGAGGTVTSSPVHGVIQTRYLRHGTRDVKRFSRLVTDLKLASGDQVSVSASLLNPDATSELFSVASTAANERTIRTHIGRRAVACGLNIETTAGRPEITGYMLEATISDRSNRGV